MVVLEINVSGSRGREGRVRGGKAVLPHPRYIRTRRGERKVREEEKKEGETVRPHVDAARLEEGKGGEDEKKERGRGGGLGSRLFRLRIAIA